MTLKQTLLKFLYPVITKIFKAKTRDTGISVKTAPVAAHDSFYSLQATRTDKSVFNFSSLKGKKVLLVNIASNCGFTAQYEELEKLSRQYSSKLVVLGFPANDFKGQEPGTDEEIESFCRVNYGVTFPVFTKASVIKPGPQPVFDWLSNKSKNGWNDLEPSWNFCKYLVDEEGQLMATFKSFISPLDATVTELISQ